MASLTHLDVSNNSLAALPVTLCRMKNLQVKHHSPLLCVMKNPNQTLPILQLKIDQASNLYCALKLSIARRNAIVDLAAAVPVFCLLQSLTASNNALTNIDPRIGLLPMLKSITVDGNPLKLVSPRVQGMPKILSL